MLHKWTCIYYMAVLEEGNDKLPQNKSKLHHLIAICLLVFITSHRKHAIPNAWAVTSRWTNVIKHGKTWEYLSIFMVTDRISYPIYVIHFIVNSETTIEQSHPDTDNEMFDGIVCILHNNPKSFHYWDMLTFMKWKYYSSGDVSHANKIQAIIIRLVCPYMTRRLRDFLYCHLAIKC